MPWLLTRTMVKTACLFLLLAMAVLPAISRATGEPGADPWAARRAKLDQRPKKIFAHYMVCYPVGMYGSAPGYAIKHEAPKIRHDSPDMERAFGGRGRAGPLLPDGVDSLTAEQSADLEIRRAMRAGIDGFAFDVLPLPEDRAFAYMDAMFKVAESNDYPFEITWCLDNAGKNPVVVEYLLREHGKSPKLARRDGKVLFFGYQSIWQALHHGDGVRQWAERPEWKGKEVGAYAAFRGTPEGWRTYRSGFRYLEERFKTPMYFQFSMSAFFHGTRFPIEPKPERPLGEIDAAGMLAEDFDSIGDFSDINVARNDAMAKAVLAKGAEWGEPMMYQYENVLWSAAHIRPGTDLMRERWERARTNDSTLIQFTTWNDYTELTMLAPTETTRYALLDLNAYFVQWWKTGQPPKPDRDRVYLTYPKYAHQQATYPFGTRARWRDASNVLEVLTLLTRPATVRLPGRPETWQAPAGLSWKQVPLKVGPVSAELVRRNGLGMPRVELRLDSPEPVTDRPYREQHSMVCVSTEDLRHWKEDFGEVPAAPILRGEYGDEDGDGLPNWFEMYWFGKSIVDWPAVGAADPHADPDGDGRSNLDEYRARTDPTNTARYAAGYRWDLMATLGPRRRSFNPDVDEFGTPVWHYLHQYSTNLPIAHDGNYWPCERFGWEPGKPLQRCVFAAPWNTPLLNAHSRVGQFTHEWTAEGEGEAKRETYRFRMVTGRNCLRVLAWQSPVAGKVALSFELDPTQVSDNERNSVVLTLEHSRPQRELARWELMPKEGGQGQVDGIQVQPGDRLYLVATCPPIHDGHGALVFKKLEVTRVETSVP